MDDRRAEPRYLVKEDGFVWDLRGLKAGYHSVSIADVSRNGMRLKSVCEFKRGGWIAVDYRGMIVCASIQYCRQVENGFAIGVRITDVLDPLWEEPDGHSETADISVHDIAALV